MTLKEGAVSVLDRIIETGNPPDKALSEAFRHPSFRHFGSHNRRRLSEIVYLSLRYKRSLSWLASDDSWPAIVEKVLNLGHSCDKIVTEKLNFLESAAASSKGNSIHPAILHEFPDWLELELNNQYGPKRLDQLASALLMPAPLTVRVNTLKSDRETVIKTLEQEGVMVEATSFSPWGIRIEGKPDLSQHPLYQSGVIEVQDEGSQLIALLLGAKRNEWIVDFCAGGGGKTLAIGAMMKGVGRLYALDNSMPRLTHIQKRLQRAELKNVIVQAIEELEDPRLNKWTQKVDRVLVDAPCSGLGTLRRNPALKWQYDHQCLTSFAETQKAILDRAAKLVKSSGILVYATCSISRIENEDVIRAFLDTHPDFVLEPASDYFDKVGIHPLEEDALYLSPDIHQTDGFYAVRLRRTFAS